MLHALTKYGGIRPVIERCDDTVLGVLESSNVREARIAAESFKNGGKRLRPALMILSSQTPTGRAIDDVDEPLYRLAAAVELIHLATLFHDDVIDEVDSRRMAVSARTKYGNHASVLAGDYVLAEALLLVDQSGLSETMPEFLRTIRVLVRGESRETNHKFDFDMSEVVYREIISEKSASLFALSCKAGGMSVGSEFSDLLGHVGWNLGMAFQMIDDLDDMLELDRETMDCDLQNGYLALPVIHTLQSLQDGHRDALIEIIRRGAFSGSDERQIVTLLQSYGGIERAHEDIAGHLAQAHEGLDRFPEGDAQRMLKMIVDDLRSYADAQLVGLQKFSEATA